MLFIPRKGKAPHPYTPQDLDIDWLAVEQWANSLVVNGFQIVTFTGPTFQPPAGNVIAIQTEVVDCTITAPSGSSAGDILIIIPAFEGGPS